MISCRKRGIALKRILIYILVLTLFSTFTHCKTTYAADAFKVSADNSKVKLIDDGKYLIPVNLYDNSGIMGFRVMLTYDSKRIRIISISKGFITADGNFAADISDVDGTANIIWNHTADVKIAKGSLFFIAAEKLSDDIEIDMSFSQPDTFNEKYKDVCLKCNNIVIKSDVQTKNGDVKSAELTDAVNRQDTNKSSDSNAGDGNNNSETDYGSRSNISSEVEAEKNAINDYVANKQENADNISKSYDKLKNDGYVTESSVIEDKENDMHRDKDLYIIGKLTTVILIIIILFVVCICYKKYDAKNMEGNDEEKN